MSSVDGEIRNNHQYHNTTSGTVSRVCSSGHLHPHATESRVPTVSADASIRFHHTVTHLPHSTEHRPVSGLLPRFSIHIGARYPCYPHSIRRRAGYRPAGDLFWHTTTTLPVLGLEYPPLVSIFSNPNTLSFVCAISAISLLRQIEFDTVSRILFAINVGGLYLSGARASILAFLAAIALLTVYKVLGTWATVTSSIAGLCIVFALPVLAIWELVPINLAGRQDLWRASYYAFLEAPLYGHGPSNLGQVIAPYVEKTSRVGVGPHNSFIAIFLIGGVITGLAYLYFLFESFRVSACFLDEPNGIVIHLLLVATLIMAMFSGSTVFGLSTVSVVSALVAGYALSQVRTQTHFQS